MTDSIEIEVNSIINKLQYLLGEVAYKSVIEISNMFGYNQKNYVIAKELVLLIDYFYYLCQEDNEQKILQYIDFIEARYNLNKIPYIQYPKRYTIISTGTIGIGSIPSLQQVTNIGNFTTHTIVHDPATNNSESATLGQVIENTVQWIEITENVNALKNKGYISNAVAKLDINLPDAEMEFTVRAAGYGTGGWRVIAPAGGNIQFLYITGITSLESTENTDAVELLATAPGIYRVISSLGNITYNN